MRNKQYVFSILLFFLLVSCNMPGQKKNNLDVSATKSINVLWDLGVDVNSVSSSSIDDPVPSEAVHPTATPQLFKAVNFEEAFLTHQGSDDFVSSVYNSSGNDSAQWLYFSPGEHTTEPIETLYTAFTNTGETTWNTDYSLEFYAGFNPCKSDRIPLSKSTNPGEEAVFEIPISSAENNWKACWYLLNPSGEALYDFCYSHGNGTNSPAAQSAQIPSSGSQDGVFPPFVKHEGTAPARFSNDEFSAEFLSTSPATGHDFKAYDHYEELTASFQNNGTAVWDSSFSLVFYAGYNWMHANSFPLPGTVNQGETASITMPMEIFEDNDRWYTCWYLAAPDGKNLADFCFNYFTSS